MIIHSYYYGPIGKGPIDFKSSPGLTQLVGDDLVRDLYNRQGNGRSRIQFSDIHQTRDGPILAVTRIEPTQTNTRGHTETNRTIFVSLKDIADDLARLLDEPAKFPLQPERAAIKKV